MGIRISEMEEATTFGADDYVPIVTNGTNKKALGQKIKDFIAGFFVSKSGDSMTGDLDNSASFANKFSGVQVDNTSNNHVSENTQLMSAGFKDNSGFVYSGINAQVSTSGIIESWFGVKNKKTDGTIVSNYIDIIVDKDGIKSYEIADAAAFRSAIGLGNILSEINLLKYTTERITDLNIDIVAIMNAGTRVYFGIVPSNAANLPSITTNDKAGYCITFIWDAGGFATQMYVTQAERTIYTRYRNNSGTWSVWERIGGNIVKTVTGTTDNNGNLYLALSGTAVTVTAVRVADSVAIPFVYNNLWYASVRQTNNFNAIANTSKTATVYYV